MYQAHASALISGHVHDFEQFARMDATGKKGRDGVRVLVAGRGGTRLAF
jgi:hypothetical protein